MLLYIVWLQVCPNPPHEALPTEEEAERPVGGRHQIKATSSSALDIDRIRIDRASETRSSALLD